MLYRVIALLTVLSVACVVNARAGDRNNLQAVMDETQNKLDVSYEKPIAKSNNNRVINWFPIIFYTQESSLAIGAGTMRAFRKKQSESGMRFNSVKAMAFYTLNRQFLFELAPEFYFSDENYNLKFRINYSKMPSLFFGTGDEFDIEDEGEDYEIKNNYFQSDFIAKLYRSFRAGIRYEWHDYTITEKELGGLLDQNLFVGQDGGTLSGIGIIFDQDNRDNTFATTSGAFHQLVAMKYSDSLGSDFEFNQYIIDLRQFFLIAKKGVLAFQAVAQFSKGDVPFNRLAQLGGSYIMRGIYQGRYRDKNLLAFQGEYRYSFKHRWFVSVFGGVGEVAHTASEFNGSDIKYSVGGGIRFALDPKNKLHLRFDVGVSEFGVSPVIILGEAF